MKKIILLVAVSLFVVSGMFAQDQVIYRIDEQNAGAPINEPDNNQFNHPWVSIGGATVEAFNWLAPNPLDNDSQYGVTIWRTNDQDGWAGGYLDYAGSPISLGSKNNSIKLHVYKNVPGNVMLELKTNNGNGNYHKWHDGEGWDEINFTIDAQHRNDITYLGLSPHDMDTNVDPIPANVEGQPDYTRMNWNNIVAYYTPMTSVENTTIDSKVVSTSIYTVTGSHIGNNLELNTLQKGIYILKNLHENGLTSTEKVAVQ